MDNILENIQYSSLENMVFLNKNKAKDFFNDKNVPLEIIYKEIRKKDSIKIILNSIAENIYKSGQLYQQIQNQITPLLQMQQQYNQQKEALAQELYENTDLSEAEKIERLNEFDSAHPFVHSGFHEIPNYEKLENLQKQQTQLIAEKIKRDVNLQNILHAWVDIFASEIYENPLLRSVFTNNNQLKVNVNNQLHNLRILTNHLLPNTTYDYPILNDFFLDNEIKQFIRGSFKDRTDTDLLGEGVNNYLNIVLQNNFTPIENKAVKRTYENPENETYHIIQDGIKKRKAWFTPAEDEDLEDELNLYHEIDIPNNLFIDPWDYTEIYNFYQEYYPYKDNTSSENSYNSD